MQKRIVLIATHALALAMGIFFTVWLANNALNYDEFFKITERLCANEFLQYISPTSDLFDWGMSAAFAAIILAVVSSFTLSVCGLITLKKKSIKKVI